MPLSIKTKQVTGVTLLVGLVVIVLAGWHLILVAKLLIDQTHERTTMMVNVVRERVARLVATGADMQRVLPEDEGLATILAAIQQDRRIAFASVVDRRGVILADGDPAKRNTMLQTPDVPRLADLLEDAWYRQVGVIYARGGRILQVRLPLLVLEQEIGAIHVAVTTFVLRDEFETILWPTLRIAAAVLIGAMIVAMLLAQVVLRPIHVIRSGLAQLGRGELDAAVDLGKDPELADFGESFRAIHARLTADRTEIAGQRAIESVVDHLEDAVGLVGMDARLLFANSAMQRTLGAGRGALADLLPASHPFRAAVETSLQTEQPTAPRVVEIPGGGERLVLTDLVPGGDGRPIGVLLVARNLAYLSEVETTLSYSQKLTQLNKLTAGIAHEIKNPLNAAMIHGELLRLRLAEEPEALDHLTVIAKQLRRLDEVVQGFLKFTRPEELALRPVRLAPLIDDLMPIVRAEAGKSQIDVRVDVPADLPPASADAGLLQQAFLNLALNACQAMPHGGRLRIAARPISGKRLEVLFEDTGEGISPEHLSKIFDLYFTTKPQGSGIGLSLVYRTVQLHDGELEVQSSPGSGTTFRLLLRQADANVEAVAQVRAS
jgi:signal transduction histidine kinase